MEQVKPLNDRLPMLTSCATTATSSGAGGAARRLGIDTAGVRCSTPALIYRQGADLSAAERRGLRADADSLQRTSLLATVREMLALEDQLDRMGESIQAEESASGALAADYSREPTTALMILLGGLPDAPFDSLVVEDETGQRWRCAPGPDARLGLSRGGLARVAYDYVEPRAQTWTVRLYGAAWAERGADYVSLAPARDQITALELDLSALKSAGPATPVSARAWVEATTARVEIGP